MSNNRIEILIPVKPLDDILNAPTHPQEGELDYHPSDDPELLAQIEKANSILADEHAKQEGTIK